jgi:hypothetical protein
MRFSAPADSYLWHLLEKHPAGADLVSGEGFSFDRGDWPRSVATGDTEGALTGLIELTDNNPFVCAERVSTPSPLSTLALIALGPLIRAGLPTEEIMLQASRAMDAPDLAFLLDQEGINQSVTLALDDEDLGSVLALNALVPIAEMHDWSLLDALFEESYGRSFFVRPASEWNGSEVASRPWAVYDLRITPGEGSGLLTVRVMADLRGKAGECQMIHTMNVMAGFEEHLGIPDLLP